MALDAVARGLAAYANSPAGIAALTNVTNPSNTIACVGDSRLAYGLSVTTGSAATTELLIRGVSYWLPNITNRMVEMPAALNFAVAGSTSEDAITQAQSVAASNAGGAVVLTSTNDRLLDWSAARTIAALTTVLTTMTNAGKQVFIVAELPRGDTTYTSARLSTTRLQIHNQVRRWIKTNAKSIKPGLIEVVDTYSTFADMTSTLGDAIVGMTWDGLHPSPTGSLMLARAIKTVMDRIYVVRDVMCNTNADQYNATNNPRGCLLVNPVMSGTGGTVDTPVTGNLASSWRVQINTAGAAGALVVAASKVTTATGAWQQFVISGTTASNSNPGIYLTQDVTLANTAASDNLEAFLEWEVDGSSTGFLGPSLSLIRNYSGGSETVREGRGSVAHGLWPTVALTGQSRTPSPLTLQGNETSITGRNHIWLAESATISTTVRVRNFASYKII